MDRINGSNIMMKSTDIVRWCLFCVGMFMLQVWHAPPYTTHLTRLQLQWAVEYIFMTPLLLQNGMSPWLVSYAWLPSPLFQILLSPILGHMSDNCDSKCVDLSSCGPCPSERTGRYGRRRPFIAVTAVIAIVALSCVPIASRLGEFAGISSTAVGASVSSFLFQATTRQFLAIGPCHFWLWRLSSPT